jgi:hypothetical protein
LRRVFFIVRGDIKMTKYQIISPNGVKVCIIEADMKMTNIGLSTNFYNIPKGEDVPLLDEIRTWCEAKNYDMYLDLVADIPVGWVAIPVDSIVTEE